MRQRGKIHMLVGAGETERKRKKQTQKIRIMVAEQCRHFDFHFH